MADYPSTDFSKAPPIPPPMPGSPQDFEAPVSRRGRRWLWTGLSLLALALAGTSWYQIGILHDLQGRDSQQTHAQDAQWLKDAAGLRDRLGAAERAIISFPSALPEEFKKVRARVDVLDQKLNTGLERARKASQEMVVALRSEIRASSDEQKRVTEAKFQALESQRQAEAVRAAQLEKNVADLNEKLASVNSNLNLVQAGVKNTQQAAEKDSVEVRREIQRTGDRIAQMANFQNRRRERFEVVPGRTQEIAPGILLHISKIDPRFRRFHGWLQLIDDGKILWLRDESMLQTVAFYSGKNALRHDIVVTDMSKPSVAGYLIYPSVGESAGSQIAGTAVAR